MTKNEIIKQRLERDSIRRKADLLFKRWKKIRVTSTFLFWMTLFKGYNYSKNDRFSYI